VVLGPLRILFSYETPVAFCVIGEGWVCSENIWSETTGKHMSQETPVHPKDRIQHEEFVPLLESMLARLTFDTEAMR
jgi:hypothetical protein